MLGAFLVTTDSILSNRLIFFTVIKKIKTAQFLNSIHSTPQWRN